MTSTNFHDFTRTLCNITVKTVDVAHEGGAWMVKRDGVLTAKRKAKDLWTQHAKLVTILPPLTVEVKFSSYEYAGRYYLNV